jgi:hypothetical protein
MTRESWLLEATKIARSDLFGVIPDLPALPSEVRVTCGWPSKGGLGKKKRTVGQCWPTESSAGGFTEILVSPFLDRPVEVVETLLHELIHAAVGVDQKHKGAFITGAKAIGFTKPWTSTPPTTQLTDLILTKFLPKLGEYPHKKLDAVALVKSLGEPDHNRQLKLLCSGCGYIIRTTKKWIDIGLPTCVCGQAFTPPEETEKL